MTNSPHNPREGLLPAAVAALCLFAVFIGMALGAAWWAWRTLQ